jgi:CDP-diacylglycerol---glycerol-3-phosphate 3-phosphatidyltransferase
MTLATWVTFSRLLAVPYLLYALRELPGSPPDATTRWLCLAVFLIAASTDWLDGYLARRLNQITELGKFLDPLVDKVLILAPLMALVELDQIPAWTVFLILFRELAIAGWRVNQTQVSGANIWGKLKTVSQIIAVSLLIAPLPAAWPIGLTWTSYAIAIALTWISGLLYLLPAKLPTKTSPG